MKNPMMKLLQLTTLKTTVSTGLVAIVLGAAVGCVATDGTVYPPYGDYPHDYKDYKKVNKAINKDVRRPAVERLAAGKVNSMGYRVKKVDYKEKQGIVKVKAMRGGQDYKIELGYPSMNVIKIKKD